MKTIEYTNKIIKYGSEIYFDDVELSFKVITPIGNVEYFKSMADAIDYAKYIDGTH